MWAAPKDILRDREEEPARSRRHSPHPRDTLTLSAPNKERELHPHHTSNSFAHDGGEEQEKMINRAPCHKRRRHRSPSPRRASKASATKDNGQEESEAGRVRKRRGVRGKEEKNGNNGNIGGRSRRGFGGKEGENGNNDNLGGRSRRGVGGKEEENGNNENLGGHSHHHRKHYGVPPSLPANRRTWYLRCARYLAISPQFTCEFAGNANKCTRCAKWQDECVPVPPAEAPLLRNLLGLLRHAQVSTGEKAAEYHRQVQETARALSSPPPQQP
ncbi:hypothetical protein V498_10265 [Pseudogymnoascus sp. VKM F-4517 (FW-2822)]|nr:hypothetical protein V498_10265 [Pseudogymnoascus sp. VKM F-4517 (FW-2822)]